jgi:hypothetical protein
VAQENQHKLPLLPELAEAFGRIVRQGHRQIGRFRVILFHLFFSQTDDTVPLLARWSSMSLDRTRLSCGMTIQQTETDFNPSTFEQACVALANDLSPLGRRVGLFI